MIDDINFLNLIYKNAQMGVEGINDLTPISDNSQFLAALKSQRAEYRKIASSADELLRLTGTKPTPISPIARTMTFVMTNTKTMKDRSAGKMAEMMIEGSTKGVIQLTKELNAYNGSNGQVTGIANQLLKTEYNNIEQMKRFL